MKTGPSDEDEAQHLKQVSRIKHVILQKYLPPWEQILGSRHSRICYFDCYAGPGIYECQDQMVDGSPIIAITRFFPNAVAPNGIVSVLMVGGRRPQRPRLEAGRGHRASLSSPRYPAIIPDITKDILAHQRAGSLLNLAISRDIKTDTDEDIRADTSLDKISD